MTPATQRFFLSDTDGIELKKVELQETTPSFFNLQQECQTTNFLAMKDLHICEKNSLPRRTQMEPQDYNTQNDTPFFSPQSHSMNVGIAIACKSTDAALIFNHIFFWLEQNKGHGRNQIGGRTWMYETIPKMQLHFPYLSEMQVKRCIAILVENGYLIKENYSENKFDRTNWYAVPNEDWLDIQKMFTKGHRRPMGSSPATVQKSEVDPCYIDKDHNTDHNKDRGGEHPRPISSKKKKEEVPMVQFGDYVQLKQGDYDKLVGDMGKDFVDYYIQAINNHVPNSKGYSDYAAVIRQWHLRDRAKNTLPDVRKIKETALPPSPDRLQANRKMCVAIENKLRDRFSSLALFHVDSTRATLINKHKDFKRDYDYDKVEPAQLKEILLRDLEVCFPGSRDKLLGNTNKKITNIIANLSEKYTMKEAQ